MFIDKARKQIVNSGSAITNGEIPVSYRRCGFLPAEDPQTQFSNASPFSMLDEIGNALPAKLLKDDFRHYARQLQIPLWPANRNSVDDLPEMYLYYVRVGFLASGYINQIGKPPLSVLPANIAIPLCRICDRLNRPPILSYDGYALYNWYRLDNQGPIALGNIETIQNFVELYDEHWFILVHVEIEAVAARILDAISRIHWAITRQQFEQVNSALMSIHEAIEDQIIVLRRIPGKMDPALYYKTFRPYIRFFENVTYEGVDQVRVDFRGETGAQSSIMPLLQALMKIPHKPSLLINHLADMRRYMPVADRQIIEYVKSWPSLRELASRDQFNAVLESMASFREVHYGWAEEYINRRTDDPLGTGGTPFMKWLKQLIDETRNYIR